MVRYAIESSKTKIGIVGKSSFWYSCLKVNGPQAARKWTRDMQGEGVFDNGWVLLVPICENDHWFMLAIDTTAHDIKILDSMSTGITPNHMSAADRIRQWLYLECGSEVVWPLKMHAVPQQGNIYDCGVFLIGFVQAMAIGGLAATSTFNQGCCLGLRLAMLRRALSPAD